MMSTEELLESVIIAIVHFWKVGTSRKWQVALLESGIAVLPESDIVCFRKMVSVHRKVAVLYFWKVCALQERAALQESGVTLQKVALWCYGFDGIFDGKGNGKKTVKIQTSFSHGTSMGLMEVLGLPELESMLQCFPPPWHW